MKSWQSFGVRTMRFFTHYWTNQTWEEQRPIGHGEPLLHTASNTFRQRGVEPGDCVYVLTVSRGVLFLGGKMIVESVADQQTAEHARQDSLYEARDHLLASHY